MSDADEPKKKQARLERNEKNEQVSALCNSFKEGLILVIIQPYGCRSLTCAP